MLTDTEYIGQLENEVAAKATEAHELRLQNRALFEENANLTDLARMLLSSPHFSSFLEDSNMSGVPAQAQPAQQPAQQQPQQAQPPQLPSQPQQQPVVSQPMQSAPTKEATANPGPQQFPMQQNPQVGMVMVPSQAMDISTMDMNNGGWNSGIDMNYGNASVFAVTEVPEGPALTGDVLSGKSSNFAEPASESAKGELPALELPPIVEGREFGTGSEIEMNDPAFPLYSDSPASTDVPESFNGVRPEKESPAFEIVVESELEAAKTRLKHLCSSMEPAYQRISKLTSHL